MAGLRSCTTGITGTRRGQERSSFMCYNERVNIPCGGWHCYAAAARTRCLRMKASKASRSSKPPRSEPPCAAWAAASSSANFFSAPPLAIAKGGAVATLGPPLAASTVPCSRRWTARCDTSRIWTLGGSRRGPAGPYVQFCPLRWSGRAREVLVRVTTKSSHAAALAPTWQLHILELEDHVFVVPHMLEHAVKVTL